MRGYFARSLRGGALCAVLAASLTAAPALAAVPEPPPAAAGPGTGVIDRSWVVTNATAPFTTAAPLPTPARNPGVPQALVADGNGVLQAWASRPAGVFVNRWTAAAGWSLASRVSADRLPVSVRVASSGRLSLLVWTTAAVPTTVRVAVRSSTGRWGPASTLACRPGPDGILPLASADAVAVTGCADGRSGWLRTEGGTWTEVPSVPASTTQLAGTSLVALDATAADGSLVGRAWTLGLGWTAVQLQPTSVGRRVDVRSAVDGTTVTAVWRTLDCRACAGSSDQPLVDVAAAYWTSTGGWSAVDRLWSGSPTSDLPNGTTVGEIALAAGGGRAVVAFDAADPYDGFSAAPRPDVLLAAVRGSDGAWRTPRVLASGHWATWPSAAVAGGLPWVGWVRTVSPAGQTAPWLRPGLDARVVALADDGAPTTARVVSASRPAKGDRMVLAATPAGLVAAWGRQANLWRAATRLFAVPTVLLGRGYSPELERSVVAAGSGALILTPGSTSVAATASFLAPTVRRDPTIRRSPGSLRCVPPVVTPSPRVMSVRWTRDGRTIPGQRAFVHRVTSADRGRLLRCVVGLATPASPAVVVRSTAARG